MLPDNWLVDNIRKVFWKEIRENRIDEWVRQGWIHTAYTSGNPRVRFVGEDSPGLKSYPYIASYTPVANDHVLLVRLGKTYIIVGKIV